MELFGHPPPKECACSLLVVVVVVQVLTLAKALNSRVSCAIGKV